MKTHIRRTTLFSCLFFSIAIFSCQKKDNPTPNPPANPTRSDTTTTHTPLPPAISSISPIEGGAMIQVTISGQGFSDTLSHDSVFFNGIKAPVVSASSGSIVATVPIGAGTGKVSVFVNGTAVAGPQFTYDSTYIVTSFAGNGTRGLLDGTGLNAKFSGPFDVVADADGNLYITDMNAIRKITPAGVVSTMAGGSAYGYADGTGAGALFNSLMGIAIDNSGNLYVSDGGNGRIRKITPAGVVTTLAGNGVPGSSADGTGASAGFTNAAGVAVDKDGNVYTAQQSPDGRIRKITPAGVVTTIAGNSTAASTDGVGIAASFSTPLGITIDGNGNLYVSEGHDSAFNGAVILPSHRIRKIAPDGTVTTFAGGMTGGEADGTGTAATFSVPGLIRTGADGNLYVPEITGYRIRIVSPTGVVTTFAGSGTAGMVNGPVKTARFYGPSGITTDNKGNIYVVDAANLVIRKISRQ